MSRNFQAMQFRLLVWRWDNWVRVKDDRISRPLISKKYFLSPFRLVAEKSSAYFTKFLGTYKMKQKLTIRNRCWQLVCCVLLMLAIWNTPQSAFAQTNQKDIDAIINTGKIALQALNSRNFAKIEPYLHPTFTITTVDNKVFHKAQDFEAYWNKQFSKTIKDIKMSFTVDEPRRFLSPETEVSYGNAISTFYFQDGNSADMAMRWTAVMQKFQGRWMIQSLHFSSNLLDNPVLKGAQQQGNAIAVAASLIGVLLGALGMLLWQRRRKQRTV